MLQLRYFSFVVRAGYVGIGTVSGLCPRVYALRGRCPDWLDDDSMIGWPSRNRTYLNYA